MKNRLTILSFLLILTPLLLGAQAPDRSSTPPPDRTTNPNLPTQNINIELKNPFKGGDTIQAFFKTIIRDIVFPIGGVIAVLAFIWSGFLFVKAQGNDAKLTEAKKALLYTAIGTAILLGAWVIMEVITGTINQLKT